MKHRTRGAVAAWSRVVRLYQKIEKLSEQGFRASGLNSAWFDVLARVGAREGQTQGELADSLLVTKGNVSQLIAKMQAEGLIERRQEGRSQRLYLTPRGRQTRESALPRQEELLTQSLERLTPEEVSTLIRLLKKWEA